ncbi:MAG: ArsC/Spx/MgsR family protein [Flavobacterium sp.]|jgi:arsenate reductase|uniref:ArsC/Spx/MgsR family protein n=1 Tax=Flavobacterium sp. TaxID=239 RepID=UPI002D1FB3C6|nr:ArsC/Spx/MgsR family protein [Flavobacterium sp.]
MTILHNPRCGKSRQCLAFLEENNKEFTIIKYLENPLTFEEIKKLLAKLKLTPIELVRQKESIWVEHFKSKNLTDTEIIQTLAENPILIERPIVIDGDNAYIARDENMLKNLI